MHILFLVVDEEMKIPKYMWMYWIEINVCNVTQHARSS